MKARAHIPPSTLSALDTWAAQKRRLFLHDDLLPPAQRRSPSPMPCIMGKIKYQQSAAGEGDPRMRQRWPEVYTGDGFLVERAVRTLRELPRITLTFYYVLRWPWRVPIPDQAAEIGITRREYWNELRVAESAIDTGLQLMHERNQKGALPLEAVNA